MRHLLVINPNTSDSVSALLQHHAQEAAGSAVRVRTRTARFGAPYISCEASYTVAGHATLDTWAAALAEDASGPSPDAVLIGCFGDPGLLALRDSSPVPVTGLAEASFIAASQHGRYAIVTGGERWGPMLQRLALILGQAPMLAGIHTVKPTGAQLAADPNAARALLAQACRDTARVFGVRSVILGGAGLAGMAAAIQHEVEVPVIDSVVAGTHWALRADAPGVERSTPGFDVAWDRLSPGMTALGAGGWANGVRSS
jgi:Asp/Glu/hydantoin racemase